jgi:hypothetical protein
MLLADQEVEPEQLPFDPWLFDHATEVIPAGSDAVPAMLMVAFAVV